MNRQQPQPPAFRYNLTYILLTHFIAWGFPLVLWRVIPRAGTWGGVMLLYGVVVVGVMVLGKAHGLGLIVPPAETGRK